MQVNAEGASALVFTPLPPPAATPHPLPGLTKVPIDGQPKSIVAELENMARDYVKHENVIILAVGCGWWLTAGGIPGE